MTDLREIPDTVREIAHCEVPMPDGCRLAARIWMPADAAEKPVPAILEYIPYRKSDVTQARDVRWLPLVAAAGYAVVRVDLRGSGDSEGVLRDEYTAQELRDGCDVIAWIARQTWCDGGVGMIGISWGGFNGLQVAALRPPALKAVVTCCSTDDRYADDVHYMGGTMVIDQVSWAGHMFARNTLPPDPANVGERWRADWLRRLKESGLWLRTWLDHQARDDYWRHGSVCEDWGAIEVPVYAVGGWADGYPRAVFRLVENLRSPCKGLVGPWAHTYPHIGSPGPAIDFVGETLRWWDHWLKGRDTGIMAEPKLRLYMQDPVPPASAYDERPGRWVAEPSWPSPNVARRRFRLDGDGRLAAGEEALAGGEMTLASPLRTGLAGGKWCSYALPGDQPVDQRPDDAGSLVFETEPLAEDLEIAGDAVLHLAVASDRPVAQVIARLVDVHPDGRATRVSYGPLNLTHRDGYAEPSPLEPGRRYMVAVNLKHVAQRFPAGHRLRLSLSTSYFPVIWPAPEPAALTVWPADSALELPVRAPSPDDARLRPFDPPVLAPPLAVETLQPSEVTWRVIDDLGGGETRVEIVEDRGVQRLSSNGMTLRWRTEEVYGFAGDDYGSPSGATLWELRMSRGDWSIRTRTETTLTASADAFHVEARLVAWEGEETVHEERWREDIPRRLL